VSESSFLKMEFAWESKKLEMLTKQCSSVVLKNNNENVKVKSLNILAVSIFKKLMPLKAQALL
jgi:hypothetical protein